MRRFVITGLIAAAAMGASSPHPARTCHHRTDTIILAVSRDDGFIGGISCCDRTKHGSIAEKPIGRLSSSGAWSPLTNCSSDDSSGCKVFEQNFLSKRHDYRVVSHDGYGSIVRVGPMKLSDCYGYSGMGTYSEGEIDSSAIASSVPGLFTQDLSPQLLKSPNSKPILDAISSKVQGGLSSRRYFKFYSVHLGGRNLIVVQRALQDYANKPNTSSLTLDSIFSIGVIRDGQFKILLFKSNTEDEDEIILGMIRLRNGREYLVTSVHDPEGQWFRVYGIRDGNLRIVYSGGLSDC